MTAASTTISINDAGPLSALKAAHHRAHHDIYDSGTTTPAGVDHGHGPCPDPGTVYEIGLPPAEVLEHAGLSEESAACLARLAAHKPAPSVE
jgi:hypothetical protein